MAYPAVYAQQPKGTLMPGQMISVNKYNVQVERFLSQGGFAHVYLVRTAEPVYGTTHHVLKRIAVADEAMLNDVKKEVDIMRILKGHPNIVYLIDAAWHKMSDGMFEVFILMEFCSGGGIIDMMNRRLRERLTEAEILQIFVDVCEGVAAMHNLRPPLLHRDLKVENILQASATSFKLCDFGSAMPVAPRPPSTTQEMRMLEADLNKHTTLQYRAPEMVDVYQRRPIDEKSDVWALGVLLYKLCYYTTPFEEHGVLAILNVQYKFPPYPVYSQQLMTLVASMLREHGVHRPSAFEVLDIVHRMRGTKSRFTYNPSPQQPLSPRGIQSPVPTILKDNVQSTTKSPDSTTSSPAGGIQAREKVLEAIATMRRGRPSSPIKGQRVSDDAFALIDAGTSASGPWGAVRPAKAHKSGLAAVSTVDTWKARSPAPINSTSSRLGDAWSVPNPKSDNRNQSVSTASAGPANGFGDSFEATLGVTTSTSTGEFRWKPTPPPSDTIPKHISSLRPSGDAFDSLNIFSSPRSQALTLGEAQKASLSAPGSRLSPSPSHSSQPSTKFSLSPSPSSSLASTPPIPTSSTPSLLVKKDASPLLKPKLSDNSLSAEQRFPSLEELDAGSYGHFTPSLTSAPAIEELQAFPPRLPPRPSARQENFTVTTATASSVTGGLRPSPMVGSSLSAGTLRSDGVRSQQVTGTAMRETRDRSRKLQLPNDTSQVYQSGLRRRERSSSKNRRMESKDDSTSRPVLTRKHRSSVSISQKQQTGQGAINLSSPIAVTPVEQARDWLTGDDAFTLDSAVLRASPEKRTSVLHSPVPRPAAQEAIRGESPTKLTRRPSPIKVPSNLLLRESAGLTENWSPAAERKDSSSDDADEGPEEASGRARSAKETTQRRANHKGRQSSVHDLVDLWGGSSSPQKPSSAKKDRRASAFIVPASSTSGSEPGANLSGPSSSSSAPLDKQVTRSTMIRKPSLDTRRPTSNHLRQPSAPAKTPSSTSPSKSRPQSMMILPSQPIQKSISENIISSPTSLVPPPDKPRSSSRRSSISDIVSRYEAIGVQSKPGSAPAPATKPARLRVVSPTVASPTAASTRFPQISPTTSPSKSTFGSSLDIPSRNAGAEPSSPKRTSPSPVRQRTSPLPRKETLPVPDPRPNGLPGRKSPLPSLTKESIVPENKQPDEPQSASPDRPYQGVSKLIDQWQKKSEEAGKPEIKPFKAGGSRFRREGIPAGGVKGS